MNRVGYLIIAVSLTCVLILSFFISDLFLRFILCGLVLLSWLLPFIIRNETLEETEPEIEEDIPRPRIPGYEKSGITIKGCYNCNYSKDIENATFVYCHKFQQKVYRDYVCELYKS